jgi:hypothetical protein
MRPPNGPGGIHCDRAESDRRFPSAAAGASGVPGARLRPKTRWTIEFGHRALGRARRSDRAFATTRNVAVRFADGLGLRCSDAVTMAMHTL